MITKLLNWHLCSESLPNKAGTYAVVCNVEPMKYAYYFAYFRMNEDGGNWVIRNFNSRDLSKTWAILDDVYCWTEDYKLENLS